AAAGVADRVDRLARLARFAGERQRLRAFRNMIELQNRQVFGLAESDDGRLVVFFVGAAELEIVILVGYHPLSLVVRKVDENERRDLELERSHGLFELDVR